MEVVIFFPCLDDSPVLIYSVCTILVTELYFLRSKLKEHSVPTVGNPSF